MLIPVSPHKVTTTTLEIWLEHSLTMGSSSLGGALTLGHVFRFDGASPVYGQLLSLEDGHREGFWLAKLSVLLGVPALPMTTATVLSDDALSQDIHYLRGGQATSLKMGQHFTSDLSELGTITLIECPSYALQKKAFSVVLEELQPYQKHLIIDPVGHFFEDDKGFKQVMAGQDCKLSLQTVRVEKFLKLIAASLPNSLEEEGLRLLSKLIPATPDFIPFKQFLRPEKIPDMAVKSPLVHLLFEVFQEGIFANDPGEVFQPEALLNNQTSVVNLSRLKAPWKNFFYEAICQEMLVAQERMEKPHFVLTLLYPENYLSDVGQCVRKAHELGLNLILMPASYEVENLREVSNNLLTVDASGLATLQGSSTMCLPIQFHLNGTLRDRVEEEHGSEASSYTEIQGADEEFHYKQFELSETPWQSSFRADLDQIELAKTSIHSVEEEDGLGDEDFQDDNENDPIDEGSLVEESLEDESFVEEQFQENALDEFDLNASHLDPHPDRKAFDTSVDSFPSALPVNTSVENPFQLQDSSTSEAHQPEKFIIHPAPELSEALAEDSSVKDPGHLENPPLENSVRESTSMDLEELIAASEDRFFDAPEYNPEFLASESLLKQKTQTPLQEEELEGFDDGFDLDMAIYPLQPEAKAEDLENIPDISPEIEVNHQKQDSGQASHPASPLETQEPDLLKPSVSLDDEDDLTLEMQAPKAQESHGKSESVVPHAMEVPLLEDPLIEEEPLQDTIPIYKVLDVEKQQRTSQVGYQEGDKIRHDKYGVGVVNKVIPMDEHIVLNITFESVGKRLLDPNLSKIDKI